MSDRPILFSAPMVRALLAGHKTQTRRTLSKRNTLFDGYAWPKALDFEWCDWAKAWVDPGPSPAGNPGPYLHVNWPGSHVHGDDDEVLGARIYPCMQPCDRLWVRETWQKCPACAEIDYKADANCGGGSGPHCRSCDVNLGAWKSSIHLTRRASRITLNVATVRIERLQDISETNAVAEGCFKGKATGRAYDSMTAMRLGTGAEWANARDWYADLWDSINGDGAWDANPWVVAVTFTVHRANIDAVPA